jgi:hypothetical protein
MADNPNLELHARFERMRAARLRASREPRLRLTERLSLKQTVDIRRRLPSRPVQEGGAD